MSKLIAASSFTTAGNAASRVYFSNDGMAWTSKTVSVASDGVDWIAANADASIIILGDRTKKDTIIVSINGGDSFSAVTLPEPTLPSVREYLWSGGFFNGKFYVVGAGSSLIYQSTNGVNWTIYNQDVEGTAPDIAFLHVSGSATKVVFCSNDTLYHINGSDVLTAATITGTPLVGGTWVYGGYHNSRYIAFQQLATVDGETTTYTGATALSVDGISWVATAFDPGLLSFYDFTPSLGDTYCQQSWHDGTKYFAWCRFDDGGTPTKALIESTNGSTWSVVGELLDHATRLGVSGYLTKLIAVDGLSNIIYSSDQGATWDNATFDVVPVRTLKSIITASNTVYVPPVVERRKFICAPVAVRRSKKKRRSITA